MATATLPQAFLNEPTIEQAREKYLESWMLPAVRASWKNRRPSLAQFEKRFGEAYVLRQNQLKLRGDAVLDGKRLDEIQEIAEAVEAGVQKVLSSLMPPRFAESDAEPEPEAQAASGTEARTVKPGNEGKLPTAKQLYFYLHRAIEAGHSFVTIPVTRGKAAEGRAMMADGASYVTALTALRKKA